MNNRHDDEIMADRFGRGKRFFLINVLCCPPVAIGRQLITLSLRVRSNMNQPAIKQERKPWGEQLRTLLLSRDFVRVCWGANGIALFVAIVWILRDGKFPEAVTAFGRHVAALWGDDSALVVVPPLLWPRVDLLWAILTIGGISAIGIVAGLIAGSGQHRNVRSWLVVMFLLTGWLTLFTTWPELVWRGQVWRLRGSIAAFDNVAKELLAAWPDNDGEIPGLGPFMAYPLGKPRMLMFMTTPKVTVTNTEIKAIERGDRDSIHFQLAGNEEGVWLVRELGDQPQSFASGLDGEYIPLQFRQVAPGWFVVRYIYAPTILGDPGVSTERQ
jgi:hypothetical protein